MVSNVTSELEVGPTVLGEWGEEKVKLSLYKTNDFSSGFFSKEFKIELSSGTKCFCSRLRSRW